MQASLLQELRRCRRRFARISLIKGMLLPPDLRDWLPEGHLAHHVSDLVDVLT